MCLLGCRGQGWIHRGCPFNLSSPPCTVCLLSPMLVRREVGPTTLLLSGKCPSMLYQLFSHSAAAGVPLAVQLPTVVLLGCQQMEHSAVIGAGCGGCQKPYTAWHMQIDPRHLVVPCSGHVKKKYIQRKPLMRESRWSELGCRCAAGAARFPIQEVSQGRGFPPAAAVGWHKMHGQGQAWL